MRQTLEVVRDAEMEEEGGRRRKREQATTTVGWKETLTSLTGKLCSNPRPKASNHSPCAPSFLSWLVSYDRPPWLDPPTACRLLAAVCLGDFNQKGGGGGRRGVRNERKRLLAWLEEMCGSWLNMGKFLNCLSLQTVFLEMRLGWEDAALFFKKQKPF